MPSYLKGRGAVIRICESCEERFRCANHRIQRGGGRFCCQACATVAKRNGTLKTGSKKPGWWKVWTQEEDEKLRRLSGTMPYKELRKHFPNRSMNALRQRCVRVGIVQPKTSKRWTPEDDEWLRDNAFRPYRFLMKKLGRTFFAVQNRLNFLNVNRLESSDRLTAAGAAMILGTTGATVASYIKDGLLRADKFDDKTGRNAEWQIHLWYLRQFVIENSHLVDLRKVDKLSFIDLLVADGITRPTKMKRSRKEDDSSLEEQFELCEV